ncbi:MAG: ABC transporter ATP-binding protein [Lewinella sp.]|nr:ABC transporter ATP-binding protein [Lewinella sp.]
MSANLLEIKNLRIEFPGKDESFAAVRNISFTLAKGETLGIVGESGSGKSITALSLMGLLPGGGKQTSGEIWFQGKGFDQAQDLSEASPQVRRRLRGDRLSMIFQEPMTSLNPVIRCGEQVAESLMVHEGLSKAEAISRTKKLFEEVRLTDPERILQSYPHQLSGGQRQRVMIAMALASRPDILIADEPTTALDVTVQSAILSLFKDLRESIGSGVIFISHDLGVIAELADRVLIMRKGEIVESGKVEEVFSNPKHPYTKALLACRPPLDRQLKRLPTVELFEKGNSDISVAAAKKQAAVSPADLEARRRFLSGQPPMLEARGLKVRFPSGRNWLGKPVSWVNAVDEVDLSIRAGECLGLVGESGSGKTTLGRTLLGLQKADGGALSFMDQEIDSAGEEHWARLRKDMQIVFQDPYGSLNPRMTVGDAVAEPIRTHRNGLSKKDTADKALELMLKTGLGKEHFNRYPFQLSGGQRQRACIARALAVEPRFLVCDEPVSALDVSVQAQILNLLSALKEEFGLTYLFISHDLSVVKFISDRIMVMQNGKVIEQGDPAEIYSHPQHPYTRKLIAAIPKKIDRF